MSTNATVYNIRTYLILNAESLVSSSNATCHRALILFIIPRFLFQPRKSVCTRISFLISVFYVLDGGFVLIRLFYSLRLIFKQSCFSRYVYTVYREKHLFLLFFLIERLNVFENTCIFFIELYISKKNVN